MSLKVPSLDLLSHELSKLPGIGAKTAYRLALSILKKKEADIEALRSALKAIKENVKLCRDCFSYTENLEVCSFCEDTERAQSPLLCVVKSPSDINKIESSGVFKGLYHVLHGTISPLDGVGPQDLKISELLNRVKLLRDKGLSEVVIALDANIDGDTTTLYLKELLEEENIKVSRLAHGVPLGSYIDFVDQRTVGRALENRIKI